MKDTADRNAYALLTILQSHAPNGDAQQAVARMKWDAESHGATPEDIEKMFASALADGLNNGNWPWSSVTGPVVEWPSAWHLTTRHGTESCDPRNHHLTRDEAEARAAKSIALNVVEACNCAAKGRYPRH